MLEKFLKTKLLHLLHKNSSFFKLLFVNLAACPAEHVGS